MYRLSAFFLLLISISITPVNAQFSKGMRMAGATIGGAFFNSGNYDYTVPAPTIGYSASTNSLGVNLSPDYGWFISDQTVVGAQLLFGYKYDKELRSDPNNVTFYKNTGHSLNVGIGGFVRNYFSSTGNLHPFAQAGVQAGIGSSENEGFSYNNSPLYKNVFKGKSSGDFSANGSIILGVTKMINTHVGLDITAGYTYTYAKNKYKTNTSTDLGIDGTIDENSVSDITSKFTNHGFAIGVGLQIFLDRKK
jgi:hypothetical protein